MKKIFAILFLFVLSFQSLNTIAKDDDSDSKAYLNFNKKEGKPKVYIEGIRLDFDYLRRNMQFVDFVNEPAVADVHIIITQRVNGGGGMVYSMMYNNRTFENLSNYTLTTTSASSDTQDERRKIIADALKMGLMPYVNESEVASKMSIRYTGREDVPKANIEDPWKHWTFRSDLNGSLNLEESRKSSNYRINLRADKVTEDWKIRNYGQMSVYTSKVKNITEDTTYITERISNNLSTSVVNSLTERWSVGAFLSYSNSNYTNIVYSVSLKPAVEYNIFPWDISDRKVFTIAYYIGPEWKKYYEETIYDKLQERLWEHSIRLDLQLVQTWGEIQAGLNASNYLHDFTKNRVTLDTELSIRIIRGFSVNFDLRVENIHDQIYLAKGEVSLEDILLNKVQLPSTFGVNAGVGVRIQFGSIYNNIVNNRL
ncbi:MAG: hypothetical protein JXR31_09170 [Prolixibacteraceae bacterium]|nr:hypothetical protein [Prolixibacteraceae bacterium]